MGDPNRNASIVLGRSTGKLIGIAIVACALVLGIFLTALLIPAPTAGAQGQMQDPDVVTVDIQDFFFNPSQITVKPGTTVMWVNEGNHQHTVTSDDGQFDSEALMPGDSFTVTFTGSGTLTYHCEIHPDMKGGVTVDGSGGGASTQGRSPSEGTSMQGRSPSGDTSMPGMQGGSSY